MLQVVVQTKFFLLAPFAALFRSLTLKTVAPPMIVMIS